MLRLFDGLIRGLPSFVCLVTGIICTSEYKILWEEASNQCRAKYESELITYQYIGDQNLTAEIITELGVNVDAWIDGRVSELGCTGDACYRMRQVHTREDTRNPFICVHVGSIDIHRTEVTYDKARGICKSTQYKMEDVRINITRLPNDFKKPTAYWVPNVVINPTREQCTYVVSRNNETLEMRQDNCSIPKMGVCINTSYIPDHQMSTFLEVTPLFHIEEVQVAQAYMQDEDLNEVSSLQFVGASPTETGQVWDLKSLLPFAFSGFNMILFLVLVAFMLVIWKRVTSNRNKSVESEHPPEVKSKSKRNKRKKKFLKNTMYQCVPASSPGNSTRVKMLSEEENPYSEITGKGACFNDEVGPSGPHGNGYVDMKGMPDRMRNGAYCSSFKLGKSSSTQMCSMYDY